MYEWYFLGVEENDEHTLIRNTKRDTEQQARDLRDEQDCPEGIVILKVSLVE
jgi:hypothetical protein